MDSRACIDFPMLLRKTTAREVAASFARVKVADVKCWTTKHLPDTVAAKRQRVFREATAETKTKETRNAN